MPTTNMTVTLKVDNISKVSKSPVIATTGKYYVLQTISVGTSEESYSLPSDIGSAGVAILTNLDTVNYIEIGFGTGVYPILLLKSQTAVIPLATATSTLYLKSNTAACDLEIYIQEQ